MTWAAELTKIRRYLRDPEGNIWDVDLIRELYNQAQQDLQNETRVLEDISVVSIPPKYGTSYLHDWETAFVTGNSYRALRQQQNYFSYCARFEVQENFSIAADVQDSGDAAYTHPFEAWFANPNKPVAFPLPDNFHSAKGFFYDNKHIRYRSKKDIQRNDPSWETQSGTPQWYYREDSESNQFIPYPRPSTPAWNDEIGDGMVTSVSGDTTGSEVGIITQRTGNILSSDSGVAVTVIDTDDNFTIIHDITPTDIDSLGDIPDWPAFLLKYVRYRTLELLYKVNNDGRIPSLSEYWSKRYRLGIEAVKRYMANRLKDRDYRFKTKSTEPIRNRRHPRLPDTYPAQP